MIAGVTGISIWLISLGGMILVGILLAIAFLILRSAMIRPSTDKSLATVPPPGASSSVEASFQSALRRLGNRITSASFRYRLPWVLLFGPSDSGKKTIIDFLPNESAHRADLSNPDGILWGFLRKGVLIKVSGSIFPDPALDQTADDVAAREPQSRHARAHRSDLWDRVLRQLIRRRPSRPLDAVVLTIAADELLGTAAGLSGRAAQIREKLNQLESGIGMVLPVYVLITRCDAVYGFAAYCRELDAQDSALKQEIFGWSNDHSIESPYRRVWVDEAMNGIGATLRRHQLAFFGGRKDLDGAGDLYLFPSALDALRDPLRILLEKLFARDSYSEGHYFRGLYFCGDPDARPAAAIADVPSLPRNRFLSGRQPAFLLQLFESRIFAEPSIARPVPQRFSRRNRLVAAAQVFIAVFSVSMALGLIVEWRRLRKESQTLSPLITQLDPALRVARNSGPSRHAIAIPTDQYPTAGGCPTQERYRGSGPATDLVMEVLEELADLRTNKFSSWFMPASHLNSINDRIDEALTEGFGKIVLRAFQQGLHEKYASLSPLSDTLSLPQCFPYSTGAPPTANQAAAEAHKGSMLTMIDVDLRPADDRRHRELECYLTQLDALEKNSARYDALRLEGGSGNIADVRKIFEYLTGGTLPPADQRYRNNVFFEHAVENSVWDPIEDIKAHRCRAAEQSGKLLDEFYRGWFGEEAPLWIRTKRLSDDILKIERSQAESASDLRTAGQSIAELDLLFPSNSADWIEQPFTRNSIPALAKMNDPVFNAVFRDDFRDELERRGRTKWLALRSGLLSIPASQSERLLETDENNQIRVASAVRTLGTNLIYLAGLDFMAPAAPATTSPSQRTAIVWNPDLLAEALKLNASWEKYQRDVLPSAPGEFRSGLRSVARRNLGENMADLVSRARTPLPGNTLPEDALYAELKNFDESLSQLKQIYAVGEQMGESGRPLVGSLNLYLQAIRLLREINQKISSDTLYSFNTAAIGKWDGTTPMSQVLYSAESPEDVADYIVADHNRLRTMVEEADPLVRLLADSGLPPGEGRSSVNWSKLAADFQQFADKKAGNPIGTLESFLRTDIDKIMPENRCQGGSAIAQNGDGRKGDPFVDAVNGLRKEAVHACLMLVRQRYIDLGTNFNAHLAGKFPFASDPTGAEAAANDVAAFYDLYARTSPGLTESLERLGASDSTMKPKIPDTIAFLGGISRAQPLFATADKNSQPALDVTTQFRSNLTREAGGNQIIDWELRIGSQTIHNTAAAQTIRWHYGDRVTLSLRYAKDSPNVPVAKEPQVGMRIQDRTVTYDFRQNWALFALLLSHPASATDFDNPRASSPNTVRLSFANAPVSSAASGSAPPGTVVFTTFSLQAPAAKDAPPAKTTLEIVPLPSSAPSLP